MTPQDPRIGAHVPSQDVEQGSQSASGDGAGRREIWNEIDQSSIMSVELIAAILTWAGIGWLIDRWLGTGPWIFGAGVMIGFAAGLYLVWYRSGRDQHYPDGASRRRTEDDATEGR